MRGGVKQGRAVRSLHGPFCEHGRAHFARGGDRLTQT